MLHLRLIWVEFALCWRAAELVLGSALERYPAFRALRQPNTTELDQEIYFYLKLYRAFQKLSKNYS